MHNLLLNFLRFVCESTCDELGTSFLRSVRIRCRKHTRTHTHTQKILKLLFFHCGCYYAFDCSNLIIVTMNECHSNAKTSDARQFFALFSFFVCLFVFILYFRRRYFISFYFESKIESLVVNHKHRLTCTQTNKQNTDDRT